VCPVKDCITPGEVKWKREPGKERPAMQSSFD
jgi:hypothetical protein